MRIAFIIAYHGAWSKVMRRAFLPSAARNADLADFYIFSSIDADVPYANVFNVNVGNLSERSVLYSERLGFNVTIHNGYKLNDFRPLDYDIFKRDLRGNYTHWGYIDTDMLLGCFSCTLGKLPFATVTTAPCAEPTHWRPPATSGGLTIVEIRPDGEYPPVDLTRHIDRSILSDPNYHGLDEPCFYPCAQRPEMIDWYMRDNITFASYKTLRINIGAEGPDKNWSWPRWPIDARGNIRRIVYDKTYLALNTWWPGDKVIPVDIRSVAFVHFYHAKRKNRKMHISDPDQWRLVQFTRGRHAWIGPYEPTLYDGMPNGLEIVVDRFTP